MDITKFLSMLDTNSLYFTSPRVLRAKFDKYEGMYSDFTLSQALKMAKDEVEKENVKKNYEMHKDLEPYLVVNCWHINEKESAAMWKIYANRGYGIAIQTTLKNLKESFINNQYNIYGAKITYLNYDTEVQPWGNAFYPYVYKRRFFDYDKEFRLFCAQIITSNGEMKFEEIMHGACHPVELDRILHDVYLAPDTKGWVIELMESLLSKYNFQNVVIHQSELDREPPY